MLLPSFSRGTSHFLSITPTPQKIPFDGVHRRTDRQINPAHSPCSAGWRVRSAVWRGALGHAEGIVRAGSPESQRRCLRQRLSGPLGARPGGERAAGATRLLQNLGCRQSQRQPLGPRIRATNKKPGPLFRGRAFSLLYGVGVTYFRLRKRHTIIGANSFRGPVRDEKAWFQAAVAAT